MKKIKASTLFEVLISLIIIGLSSSLFLSIYDIVSRSKSSKDIISSQIVIDKVFSQFSGSGIINNSFEKDGLKFIVVRKPTDLEDITEVSVNVFRDHRKIYSEYRLIEIN